MCSDIETASPGWRGGEDEGGWGGEETDVSGWLGVWLSPCSSPSWTVRPSVPRPRWRGSSWLHHTGLKLGVIHGMASSKTRNKWFKYSWPSRWECAWSVAGRTWWGPVCTRGVCVCVCIMCVCVCVCVCVWGLASALQAPQNVCRACSRVCLPPPLLCYTQICQHPPLSHPSLFSSSLSCLRMNTGGGGREGGARWGQRAGMGRGGGTLASLSTPKLVVLHILWKVLHIQIKVGSECDLALAFMRLYLSSIRCPPTTKQSSPHHKWENLTSVSRTGGWPCDVCPGWCRSTYFCWPSHPPLGSMSSSAQTPQGPTFE